MNDEECTRCAEPGGGQAPIKTISDNAFICFVLAMTLTSLWVLRRRWQSFGDCLRVLVYIAVNVIARVKVGAWQLEQD